MPVKNKERILLWIEPRFQLVILLYVNALLIILCGTFFYVLSRLGNQLDAQLHLLNLHQSHPYLSWIHSQKRSLFALYATLSALVFFLGNVGALIITHRIAGPVYRTRELLRALREGKSPAQIRFRRTDFFKDLEKDLNVFLGKY